MINIFLSYSHDSEAHQHEVVQLATKLIEMGGVDVQLDVWAGSPPEGWTLWMEKSIRDADVCLIVCSSAYYNKIMQDVDAGVGQGVKWEGRMIRNLLYADDSVSTKFIPILLSNGKPVHILTALKDATYYRPNDPAELEKLYRALTHQPAFEKPPVKPKPTPFPVIRPDSHPENAAGASQDPKDLVSKGKLAEALDLMAADPAFAESNEIILLQAQVNRLERDIRMGVLTHEQTNIQQNRLTYAILSMLEK